MIVINRKYLTPEMLELIEIYKEDLYECNYIDEINNIDSLEEFMICLYDDWYHDISFYKGEFIIKEDYYTQIMRDYKINKLIYRL